MSSTTLYRLSGFSLLIGSVLAIVGGILGIFSSDPASTSACSALTPLLRSLRLS